VPRAMLLVFLLLALLASSASQGNWSSSNLAWSRYDLAAATDGSFLLFAGGARYGLNTVLSSLTDW
jgi:hypothetical protein